MKFPKDVLIVDFEGIVRPVQVGAVLLDKETLTEKDTFLSYIWADAKGSLNKAGITQETLIGAPSQSEVGKSIYDRFGTDILLGSWVANGDMKNFEKIITAAGIDIQEYDYHIVDIWPAAYIHLLQQGYQGSIRSEEIFQAFGAQPRGLHNALEDCRIAAEILRQIT